LDKQKKVRSVKEKEEKKEEQQVKE